MNRTELLKNLLKIDWKLLDKQELSNILDFIFELPDEFLEQRGPMRQRISKKLLNHLSILPEKYLDSLSNYLGKVSIIESREDFYSYVKLIAPLVIPNEFRDGRHIQLICEELQQLYEDYHQGELHGQYKRRGGRLQVFLPPRSMKSVLCSILFPSWLLGKNPKYRILLIGGSRDVAIDVFGRPLKNLMKSEEYRIIFPETSIDPDVQSAQRFNTSKWGGFYCSGGSQGIAGRGGDFIICDDVINEQTAWSKVERTKINNNYVPGIRSRAQPGAAELIVNTRWHLDDLSGFTQKMDGYIKEDGKPSKPQAYRPWKIISIPAILNEVAVKLLKRPGDPEDLFKAGGSYWPEWKPIQELESLRQNYRATEPFKWEALYMQNPVPDEGNIIKYSDFQIWKGEKPPKVSSVVVSIDMAYSEKQRADFTAYSVWGVFYRSIDTSSGNQSVPNIILLFSEKGKWNFHELCEKLEWLRSESKWKPDSFILEKAAGNVTLIRELYRRQFPVYEFDPKGKKEERVQAASMIIKAGRVWVPLANPDIPGDTDLKPWAQELVDEASNFPSVPHDDLTDTLAMTVLWLRDNGTIHYEAYEYQDEDQDSEKEEFKSFSYWATVSKEITG